VGEKEIAGEVGQCCGRMAVLCNGGILTYLCSSKMWTASIALIASRYEGLRSYWVSPSCRADSKVLHRVNIDHLSVDDCL